MHHRRQLHSAGSISRRGFVVCGSGAGAVLASADEGIIVVSVRTLLDQGARSGKGLSDEALAIFNRYQEKARREFAVSGIRFDVHFVNGAYLRQQGYSEIPSKFLARNSINLFITERLGYDIDTDRTGGASMGPRPPAPGFGGDPYYKTFVGLKEASDSTLAHEYAHHFTLDTQQNPTTAGNFWADLRNDYWLWRQRRGVRISEFRVCAHAEWARVVAG